MKPFAISTRFLTYSLIAESTRQYLDARVQSVTRSHQRIRPETLMKMSLQVPNLEQQRATTDYLDLETARIGELMTRKHNLVGLLEERRLSGIEHTIFGGIGLDASHTRTEVNSMEDEPRTWRFLKHYCSEPPLYGLNVPASEYTDDSDHAIRLLRTTDIEEDGTISAENGVYIDSDIVPPAYRLKQGDLLLSRSGTLGRSLLYLAAESSATFAGYLVRFRPSVNIDPRYLEYCIRSPFVQDIIKSTAVSSTISNFNAERYANLRIPWRPFREQCLIADHLDGEAAQSKLAVRILANQIDLLAERRQALITAAVTGQLEIPRLAG